MKKIVLTCVFLASIVNADPYAKCVGCHGVNGEKVALGKSKIIKNMTKIEIISALNGYKDGSYGSAMKSMMKSQVSALTDSDIEFIANKIGK